VKPPEFASKDQAKCGVTKSQARPLVVEWPSADRMELENKIRQGIVAVRYQGCEMDVLERCSVPAKYRYLGATRSQDKVVMKDDDDLYANLPVGAAKLEGKLARSGQLTVDMSLVGRYESEKPVVRSDELQGECAGATHFVYGVAVGAFDFYAGGQARIEASAGLGTAGLGGHSNADRETVTKNGDPDACAKATPTDEAPPAQCGALIRVEVVPLAAPDAARAVPAVAAASAAPRSPASSVAAGSASAHVGTWSCEESDDVTSDTPPGKMHLTNRATDLVVDNGDGTVTDHYSADGRTCSWTSRVYKNARQFFVGQLCRPAPGVKIALQTGSVVVDGASATSHFEFVTTVVTGHTTFGQPVESSANVKMSVTCNRH
jgi:hypothetical protein